MKALHLTTAAHQSKTLASRGRRRRLLFRVANTIDRGNFHAKNFAGDRTRPVPGNGEVTVGEAGPGDLRPVQSLRVRNPPPRRRRTWKKFGGCPGRVVDAPVELSRTRKVRRLRGPRRTPAGAFRAVKTRGILNERRMRMSRRTHSRNLFRGP